jgi:hypothetical protein
MGDISPDSSSKSPDSTMEPMFEKRSLSRGISSPAMLNFDLFAKRGNLKTPEQAPVAEDGFFPPLTDNSNSNKNSNSNLTELDKFGELVHEIRTQLGEGDQVDEIARLGRKESDLMTMLSEDTHAEDSARADE